MNKMRFLKCAGIFFFLGASMTAGGAQVFSGSKGIYEFSAKSITGKHVPLSSYEGHPVLIVNTASGCGFTPQYASLQKLYENYKEKGFKILAFPSNDFGGQEPGTDKDIKIFCDLQFHVTFDLFSKIETSGPNAHPLYRYLVNAPGYEGPITWNFNKFLIDKDGQISARFDSAVDPLDPDLTQKLEALLSAKA